MSDGADGGACPRCGAAATGTYCGACGARVAPPPLRLRPFLAEALSELLSIERGLLRTLRALFTRPGSLTVAFREGRGGAYTPPLRLYLATGFVFFGGLSLAGVDTMYLWSLIITLDSGSLPGWVSQVVLVGVPVTALLARGVFVGTGRHYVEFLVLALYFHCFLFLVGIPITLAWEDIPGVASLGRANNWLTLAAGVWLFLALREVTAAGRLRCLVGTLAITAGYLGVMVGGIWLWVTVLS